MQRPRGTEANRFEGALRSLRPVPPKTPRPRSLRVKHCRGVAARDGLCETLHGQWSAWNEWDENENLEQSFLEKHLKIFGRWSVHKGLLTELLQASEGTSIVQLMKTLGQAQALGAQNWPEFLRAAKRLSLLQDLHKDMEAAFECVEIQVLEDLLARAWAIGVIHERPKEARGEAPLIRTHLSQLDDGEPLEAHEEFKNVAMSLEKRCHKLRKLEEDLRIASESLDMDWISNTLKVADDLRVDWKEIHGAQARLRGLQSCLLQMTELLGESGADRSEHQVRVYKVLSRVDQLGRDPPPPLGWALQALRKQYSRMRLEEVAGLRARLTHEIRTAEKEANIERLRAAVSEADYQFCLDSRAVPPACVAWHELEDARRSLARLVEVQAELELLTKRRPVPPSPTALIACIARADALGCSSWSLRCTASSRLKEVQSLEAGILKAVYDASEDALRAAVEEAHASGFASWPLLRAATRLLRGFKHTAGDDAALWQHFSSTTAAHRLLIELAEADRFGGDGLEVPDVEVAFIGLRLEVGSDGVPPVNHLAKMFHEAAGQRPQEAQVASIRSGLAVLEVRLQGSGLHQLITDLVEKELEFGQVTGKHLYSVVTRWKDEDQQLNMLYQTERAASPESCVSQLGSSAAASLLTKDVIHRELELLREPSPGVSAVSVKDISGPGSLVEEVALDATETLMENVNRQIMMDLARAAQAASHRHDDIISVASEATDLDSAQLLRMIEAEFKMMEDMLSQNQAGEDEEEKEKPRDVGSECESRFGKKLVDDLISKELTAFKDSQDAEATRPLSAETVQESKAATSTSQAEVDQVDICGMMSFALRDQLGSLTATESAEMVNNSTAGNSSSEDRDKEISLEMTQQTSKDDLILAKVVQDELNALQLSEVPEIEVQVGASSPSDAVKAAEDTLQLFQGASESDVQPAGNVPGGDAQGLSPIAEPSSPSSDQIEESLARAIDISRVHAPEGDTPISEAGSVVPQLLPHVKSPTSGLEEASCGSGSDGLQESMVKDVLRNAFQTLEHPGEGGGDTF